MLFNSIEFVLFFPLILILYWGIFNKTSVELRNLFILLSSYLFYGWWDYRFLGLIILSSFTDYFCGQLLYKSKTQKAKKLLLATSIIVNLSILFSFKYYNFFAQELSLLLKNIGYNMPASRFSLILPVGISFYTFQTLSYTIDIYRGKMKPTSNVLSFFTFVAFFPQLVAGPIERAKNLLPQFKELKSFDYTKAANGFRLILWGLFAKVAVADSLAPIVDKIFLNHESLGFASLITGAILFSIQIFGDFAGYSNIAIGTALLLGFSLMTNFRTPFFSSNLKEFWSRWHISLSTWFRDYLYIPLGGNRCSKTRNSINILITFIISGLWHGSNWTFIIWGVLHGSAYLLSRPFSDSGKKQNTKWKKALSILATFFFVSFAFIFFRAENMKQATTFLSNILTWKNEISLFELIEVKSLVIASIFSCFLFILEWIHRKKKHGLDIVSYNKFIRHFIYYMLIFGILFSFQSERIFIYFQF